MSYLLNEDFKELVELDFIKSKNDISLLTTVNDISLTIE